MQIHGPVHIHGPQPVSPPHHSKASQGASSTRSSQEPDQLDISDTGQAISKAREVDAVRQERITEIRAAIADDTYETSEKLDIAVERLLDEIG